MRTSTYMIGCNVFFTVLVVALFLKALSLPAIHHDSQMFIFGMTAFSTFGLTMMWRSALRFRHWEHKSLNKD